MTWNLLNVLLNSKYRQPGLFRTTKDATFELDKLNAPKLLGDLIIGQIYPKAWVATNVQFILDPGDFGQRN